MSGGLTTNASMSNCDIAYRIECIVRIRMSPTHSTFSPSSRPLDRQIVYRSVSTWVGCSPQPSPQLMTGTEAQRAASAGAPCW